MAKEAVSADYAQCLGDEPAATYRQREMGAPIEGETEADLKRLFEVLKS